MRLLDSYLSEYQESHQNPVNVKLHNVCVPAIMWSILALLTTFSVGPFFGAALPISSLLLAASIVFYALIAKLRTVIAMVLIGAVMIHSAQMIPMVRYVSIAVFVVAWIGQFYGHKVEGKKPSFFKDLLFLLIGPIWVLKKFAPNLVASRVAKPVA